jgi:FkbM family methyltransferase
VISSLVRTLRFIYSHPLASQNRTTAIKQWLKWQVGARILRMPIVMPFIGDAKLIVELGMTGATGNIYTGLHEFGDMSFCLHVLRKEDLFVDVGANIGSYTVLASKVVGAKTIAFEPVHQTFNHLLQNININQINSLVDPICCAVGKEDGSVKFSSDNDTMNKVVGGDYWGKSIEVPVKSLDDLLNMLEPTVIKIDVEGFEEEVIQGALRVLKCDSLLAIMLETVNPKTENLLQSSGFVPASYSPFTRELFTPPKLDHKSSNYLWIKNYSKVAERCKTSPQYQALGISF